MAVSSSIYITPRELRNAITGNNWTATFGSIGTLNEDAHLQDLCQTVSSEVDNICGKWIFNPTDKDYMLRASVNTETGITRERDTALVDEYGNLCFIVSFRPIISVQQMTFIPVPGNGMTQGTPTVVDPRNIFFQGRTISAEGLYTAAVGSPWGYWGASWSSWRDIPMRVSVTYTNGFANTLLSTNVSAGASSVLVDDPTGVKPGQQLTFFDIPGERVLVSTLYDGVSSTLPLQNPLVQSYTAGVRISTLGEDLQRACIYLAMDTVQSRAQQGLVAARKIPGFSGQGHAVPVGATDFYVKAVGLLDKYILTP